MFVYVPELDKYQPPFNLILKIYALFLSSKGYKIKNTTMKILEKKKLSEPESYILLPFVLARKFPSILQNNCKYICINTEPIYCNNKWNIIIDYIKTYATVVFDYTPLNIKLLNSLGYNKAYLVPPSYHTYYEEIYTPDKQINDKPIDVLFYGTITGRRKNLINLLKNNNINIYATQGFEKIEQQNNYIAKSKIVIIPYSIKKYVEFDFYRAPYLLSNRVLVIHEYINDESNIRELRENLIYAKYNNFMTVIQELLSKTQTERDNIVEQHYNYFKTTWDMNTLHYEL